MINLLPRLEKKNILRERRLRLVVVSLWGFFVLELLAFALFLPAYFTIYISTKSLALELEKNKQLTPKGLSDVETALSDIKKESDLLVPDKVPNPSEIIWAIVKVKPKGVDLRTVAYSRDPKVIGVQISGNAKTREDLLYFQRMVKALDVVADLKSNSTYIQKKTDIDFTLTITLK